MATGNLADIAPMAAAPMFVPRDVIRGRLVTYDDRYLSVHPLLWRNAMDGIQNPPTFRIRECCEVTEGPYFTFAIDTIHADNSTDAPIYADGSRRPVAVVRVGDASTEYNYARCTCQQTYEQPFPCPHMFFLFDQLLEYRHEITGFSATGIQTIGLRHDATALTASTPYEEIARLNLQVLAQRHHWRYVIQGITSAQASQAFDFERWPLSEQVQDILAYYSDLHHTSEEELLASNTLSGAILRLALRKPEFLADLREDADLSKCTIAYMDRIDRQVTVILRRAAAYITFGLPNGPTGDDDVLTDPMDSGAPNIVWLAEALLRRVQDVQRQLNIRGDVGPEARDRAFAVLLRILTEVACLNIDTARLRYRLQDSTDSIEGLTERNLYARLIGPYPVISLSPGAQDHFAITTMWAIADAGFRFLDQLKPLLEQIEAYHARPGYIESFKAMITQIERQNADAPGERV